MQSSCVQGERGASGLPWRHTGQRSQRRGGGWEEGPHLPLLPQSAPGVSLPRQKHMCLSQSMQMSRGTGTHQAGS